MFGAQPADILRKLVLGSGGPPAVSVDAADARLPQAFDSGIGVLGTVADVRPVEHGRDAGVDGPQGDHEISDIRVLGAKDATAVLVYV